MQKYLGILKPSMLYVILFFGILIMSLYQVKLNSPGLNFIPEQEYMKNLTLTHYLEDGKIKDQIKATYWAYFPNKKLSLLEQPALLLFKPNGAEWLVEAENGQAFHQTLNSKVEKLNLSNNVLIERLAVNNFDAVVMQTEQLSYFPESELVETDKFVLMNKPGLKVTGVGLKSDLHSNLVTLLDQVTTEYTK